MFVHFDTQQRPHATKSLEQALNTTIAVTTDNIRFGQSLHNLQDMQANRGKYEEDQNKLYLLA